MESKIDWSKAPEGADKYNTHNSMFYKGERPYLQVFIYEQWRPSAIIKSNELFVYRPSTPSWSGEGLPPVGVVCECKVTSTSDWVKCEIVAHHNQYAIAYVDDNTVMLSCGIRFRPIRTPKQIAEDARSKAIDEMVKALGMDDPGTAEYIRCGLIYDAGFRKQ